MISTTQAAALLGLKDSWVRLMCAQGRIKGAVKVGRNWVLPDKPVIRPAGKSRA